MGGESNPEKSIHYELVSTNSNPEDNEDQNGSNLFTQPIPQQQNNFSAINCLSEHQNINNRDPFRNIADQLAKKLDSIPDPPLKDTEFQNVPKRPEEIRAENQQDQERQKNHQNQK